MIFSVDLRHSLLDIIASLASSTQNGVEVRPLLVMFNYFPPHFAFEDSGGKKSNFKKT